MQTLMCLANSASSTQRCFGELESQEGMSGHNRRAFVSFFYLVWLTTVADDTAQLERGTRHLIPRQESPKPLQLFATTKAHQFARHRPPRSPDRCPQIAG